MQWYEIVNSFYANVILKKHWRNFRTYPDCFAASEAIDWLFGYLKTSPNFKDIFKTPDKNNFEKNLTPLNA